MEPTHTPPRSIRVATVLWRQAKAKAAREGFTITAVIIRFLTDYVADEK